MSITINKTHFLLFPTCIPVKGHSYSIIMDLDRGAYIEIPNLLYDILQLVIKKQSIQHVKSLFVHQYDEGINEYFDYFVSGNYGFYTDNPHPFNQPDTIFHSPYKIISSVIALDKLSTYNVSDVISQLDQLSCQLIQIRCYDYQALEDLAKALSVLKESAIRKVEIFIPHTTLYTEQNLIEFVQQFPRIILVIFGAEKDKKIKVAKKSVKNLIYTTKNLTKKTKESISLGSFTITHQMYYESLAYNTGLYRKVSIDTNGDIKNYVAHHKVYGNVMTDAIDKIISTDEFKAKYYISNDQIEKCSDCQFRYMCLTNSDIITSEQAYQKVDSCRFNPYTNTWN